MLITTRKFTTKAESDKPKKPRKRTNSDNPLTLTDYLKQVLIGLTLGDVSLEKATSNSNVRVRFDQSTIHSGYLFFLYELFMLYTLSPTKSTFRKPDKRTGNIYNSLVFKTRMLPCF
uniref:LAGLIDADG endonuclease n=1 Tax=Coniophora olivacea TaxID=85977 RepID=A0A896Z9L0_9AGAM